MKLVYSIVFNIGFLFFKFFNVTNKYAYLSFRHLHGLTNGQINRQISSKISKEQSVHSFPAITNGILGQFNEQKVQSIVSQIKENGYYQFEEKISAEICEAIKAYALKTPARTVPQHKDHPMVVMEKDDNPKAPMYKFREEDLLENDRLRSFLLDENFLRIAQEYLGSIPLNDINIMWWSTVFSQKANSKAAQLFHYDMDHPKFIKFFVYLTDVTHDSGPHTYVKGSHQSKPEDLRAPVRFSDELVAKHYSPEEIIEIVGTQGTVFAADTSGIHKGKVPADAPRLVFQLEFTNSFFGQEVKNVAANGNFTEAQQNFIKKYTPSYKRFKL